MKTIRDAVHGDIQFTEAEMRLIDTSPLQRLRGIKQLGTSNLVFPSAVHTRFEHTLGTCWLAKRLVSALESSGHSIAEEDRNLVSAAALLHDVTHVPFGHTFEDERRLFDRHDEDPDRLDHFLLDGEVASKLREFSDPQRVKQLLLGTGQHPFLRQLITGTVCADLMDYLKRDALHCGLNLDYDDRLYHYFSIEKEQLVIRLHKGGGFRRDALSELIHLLQIRYSLTERVYYHHAKIVAGAMVSRALELALHANKIQRQDLYIHRDDSLLFRLQQLSAEVEGLPAVIEDLHSRRLYKRAYLLTLEGLSRPGLSASQRDELCEQFHSNLQHRQRTETALAEKLGIPESHVIIYCPSPKMQLKEANVPVEVEPDRTCPLSTLGHPDVEALKEKHRGLWRFYVLIRRDDGWSPEKAGKLCEEAIGYRNQLASQTKGTLAFGTPPVKS